MKSLFVLFLFFFSFVLSQNQTIPSCHPNTSCNYNGVCNSLGFCDCTPGFITFPSDNPTQCNYQQKKQIGAFFLALFLTWTGAAQFYLGNIGLGIGQLIVGFVLPVLVSGCVSISRLFICDWDDDCGGFSACILSLIIFGVSAVAMFIWTLVDLILIGILFFAKDGFGAPVLPW